MDELFLHLQYSKTLIYIILGTIVLTYLVHFSLKKYRFPKYLPGFLLILVGFYRLFNTEYGARQLLGVDNIFMGIAVFASGVIGICFAWILGVYNKEKKKKIKKGEKNKKKESKVD